MNNTEQKTQEKDLVEDALNIQNQGHPIQDLILQTEEPAAESLSPDLIDMVMAHTQSSRIDAAKALRSAGGDVVLAIMNLTQDPPNQQTENNMKDNQIEVILEEWIKPEDIEIVRAQTQSSQIDAIKALRSTGGDVVQAILDLSQDQAMTDEWLNFENVDLVMAQTQSSLVDILKALKKSKGDVVSAILDLTK